MTREDYKKMKELNRKRRLLIETLFEDCLEGLAEAQDALQKQEVMLNYSEGIKNYYEAELSLKGSLGGTYCENTTDNCECE